MPTVLDYQALIAARLVALLEASTATCADAGGTSYTWATLFKETSRTDRLGVDPNPDKLRKVRPGPGEMPLADIRTLRAAPLPGYVVPKTFCDAPTVIAERVTYLIRCTYADANERRSTVAWNLLLQTLAHAGKRLSLGATLGVGGTPLNYVSGWEQPSYENAEERAGETTGGTLRLVQRIELPVNVVVKASDLV